MPNIEQFSAIPDLALFGNTIPLVAVNESELIRIRKFLTIKFGIFINNVSEIVNS